MKNENEQTNKFPKLDSSDVTDMSHLFKDVNILKEIPKQDSSDVTDMSHLFENCKIESDEEFNKRIDNLRELNRSLNQTGKYIKDGNIPNGKVEISSFQKIIDLAKDAGEILAEVGKAYILMKNPHLYMAKDMFQGR